MFKEKYLFSKKAAGYLFLGLLLLLGCVDPYTPPSTIVNYKYLVVDGIVETGGDTTRITLSRTNLVASTDAIQYETNATVSIEEENGTAHPMTSDGEGNYLLAPGTVDASKNLRVHIFDNAGIEYASAYVTPLATPPIDSVSWNLTTLNGVFGVELYVNTHDATNTAKYFLWHYDETWEYQSKYASSLIRINDTLYSRTPAQDISHCYSTASSTIALINSTTALSQDVVSEFPLAHIPINDIKLALRYSIIVHQIALSKEAYEFWLGIQKNTENLGSLFGSLPVQLTGNYSCITNPSVPVIGFLSATAEQNERIFINDRQIPPVNSVDPFYNYCQLTFLPLSDVNQPTNQLFVDGVYAGPVLIGYNLTDPACADCRLHGGTTKVPSFW